MENMSNKLNRLPEEIQVLVAASVANTAGARSHNPTVTIANDDEQANEAPTSDPDQGSGGPATDNPVIGTEQTPQKKASTNSTLPGASILRKVSQKIASVAPAGTGSRVGGSRKMNLFGGTNQTTSADVRDRWKTVSKAAAQPDPASQAAMYSSAASAPDGMQGPTAVDPQGPLIEALQGFEKQLAQDSENEEGGGDGSAAVIALGYVPSQLCVLGRYSDCIACQDNGDSEASKRQSSKRAYARNGALPC
jgi:hypothetical protein